MTAAESALATLERETQELRSQLQAEIKVRNACARAADLNLQRAESAERRCEELEREIDGLRRFKSGVDEALNSGDGSYKP